MRKHLKMIFLAAGLLWLPGWISITGQQNPSGYDSYLKPAEINTKLQDLNRRYSADTRLVKLAVSPGGSTLNILEISKGGKKNPAVLVVANMEGSYPLASMGALYLADLVLSQPETYNDLNWYILPCGNPDGAERYFSRPLYMDGRNQLPHNEDLDDQTDEDGYNDLNGDGFITQMRVKDPGGEWVVSEADPRIMRRADPSKGETGVYKMYSEGIDDDGDGSYNEDPPGGVDVSINFPHLFRPFSKTGGLWPGSTEETYQLMKYAYGHPEIAMTFAFGSSDFCISPPGSGRRGSADFDKIKIPERIAARFGADPDRTYTMKEIMEMVQPMLPQGMEVTESMISSFLGLGAMVNPMDADLAFYKELSDKYKAHLKDKKFTDERLNAEPDRDGSFELWAYYHLGLPSFTMNLFTLPKVKEEKKESPDITPEKIGAMSNEEFVALGQEKLDAFLKETGAPSQYNGAMMITMIESGRITPKQMEAMLKQLPPKKEPGELDPKSRAFLAFNDKELDGKGFVNWESYKHPALGEVEIGGTVPFAENTPPAQMIDSLLKIQVPYVTELAKNLPRLSILEAKTKELGGGVVRLEVWIRNENLLPFPTAMGERNQQPGPAILLVEGKDLEFLDGLPRTPVNKVGGKQNHKSEWLIRTDKPSEITIRLTSPNAWGDVKTVKTGS